MGIRRTGREAAVKILYTMEMSGKNAGESGGDYWENNKGSAKLKEYASSLVEGVSEGRENIDKLIGEASDNWPIDRMPEVDRSILRVAVFEMTEEGKTPAPVAINEAVEIAKLYASEESASFINGILGRIHKVLGN